MKLKFLVDEDIANYKKTAMFIGFPSCTWKCDKMNCQNSDLATLSDIQIDKEVLCQRYLQNPLTHAIVCGGLEPFDSELDLVSFIDCLRNKYECLDDIVIYTGYTEEELTNGIRANDNSNTVHSNIFKSIIAFPNIIIKYGRYIPNQTPHYDNLLGVELASNNQYALAYNYHNYNI